jgi:hypothetical protein
LASLSEPVKLSNGTTDFGDGNAAGDTLILTGKAAARLATTSAAAYLKEEAGADDTAPAKPTVPSNGRGVSVTA